MASRFRRAICNYNNMATCSSSASQPSPIRLVGNGTLSTFCYQFMDYQPVYQSPSMVFSAIDNYLKGRQCTALVTCWSMMSSRWQRRGRWAGAAAIQVLIDCILSKIMVMILTERSSKSSNHPGGGRIQDPRGPLGLFATTLRLLSYLVLINWFLAVQNSSIGDTVSPSVRD